MHIHQHGKCGDNDGESDASGNSKRVGVDDEPGPRQNACGEGWESAVFTPDLVLGLEWR